MKTHGTLVTWNDDRGFGFIELPGGGERVFVHISAFPRGGVRPVVGELVSFEIDAREAGKKRAVRVMRCGSGLQSRRSRQPAAAHRSSSALGSLVTLLLLIAIGWYGYQQFSSNQEPPAAPRVHALRAAAPEPASPFSCDGRTRCPQMHSCAEARFFLRQCPGTQMDGDGDGVPCESQWCPAE
ncbi:cold shock domain-containing protein [Dyella sp.]|jgi:cold shock CspA family protein|uniref:cold shock domain-containing protein n=1 Tax=Dyella sp. TaxID=1869338 RepID=UPI002D78DFF7|nr:cold shock domain-containing protein [Dyella sp.]HET6432667.1 cold shock domain-containing protein [Dyella sp.]